MFLAFDIGNSAVKCAVCRKSEWRPLGAAATLPFESLADRLGHCLLGDDLPPLEADRCVASSVCPKADEAVRDFWRMVHGQGGVEFFGRDLPIPIEGLVREPDKVGTDRLLCALGARETVGSPCIVVGVGTAVTVDLVDREGRFAGGAIAPGFDLAARALAEGAASLPLVEPQRPVRTAGTDTVEAIRSGIFWFCVGGVLRTIRQLREENQCQAATVVCTGGRAELLVDGLPTCEIRHVPDLVFQGMSAALRM